MGVLYEPHSLVEAMSEDENIATVQLCTRVVWICATGQRG